MINEAIGQVFSFGVGVALSPVPIVSVVLMLGTSRARTNGPAFVIGWIVGLAAVGSVVLLLSSGANASENEEPANWVNWLKLALGLALLLIAVKQWRGKPIGGNEAQLPGWMQAVETFSPPKAAGLGMLLGESARSRTSGAPWRTWSPTKRCGPRRQQTTIEDRRRSARSVRRRSIPSAAGHGAAHEPRRGTSTSQGHSSCW